MHNESSVDRFALSGDGKLVLVLTVEGRLFLRNALDGNQIMEYNAPGDIA